MAGERIARLLVVGLLAVALLAAVASRDVAIATHVSRPSNSLEEIGFHPLAGKGFNTGVWAHPTADGRLFAYIGSWGTDAATGTDPCPSESAFPGASPTTGVKVVEVTAPHAPKLAGVIPVPAGAQVEDLTVARVRNASFSGDLLVHGLAPCGTEGAVRGAVGDLAPEELTTPAGGLRLYDVSEPRKPVLLGEVRNGALGTRALKVFTRPDLGKVFVAAVRNNVNGVGVGGVIGGLSEVSGELQLFDVTDPRAVRLVSTYRPEDDFFFCYARGSVGDCFVSGVAVRDDGKQAYLSWWDGGLVVVDIAKPAQPKLVGGALIQVDGGRITDRYTGWLDEEGNTHAVAPVRSGDRRFVVVGDADYDGGRRYAEVRPAGADTRPALAVEWDGTPPLGGPGITGPVFYAGGGCLPGEYEGAPPGFVALVEEFDCFEDLITVYGHKLAVADAAGASALIMISPAPVPSGALATDGPIPAVSVGWLDGVRLRQRVDPGQPTGGKAVVHAGGPVNPWGFMRVMDVGNPATDQWRQVSTFQAPHVAELGPHESDVLSAHQAHVVGDRVFFAWWTNGVRVLRVRPDGTVAELASFAPSAYDHVGDLDADPHGLFPDNAGFWDVHVATNPRTGQELIFASDVNRGLYVLAAPRR